MERSALEDFSKISAQEFGGVTIGRIVRVDRAGQLIVDFPGNEVGPLPARSAVDRIHLPLTPRGTGRNPVLLVFEKCNPVLPIVIGYLHEAPDTPVPSTQTLFSSEDTRDLTIDGHRVTLEAKEEIVLCCGDSSITLKKNGKIVIKGAEIVSRAARTNKVKGAAVIIN